MTCEGRGLEKGSVTRMRLDPVPKGSKAVLRKLKNQHRAQDFMGSVTPSVTPGPSPFSSLQNPKFPGVLARLEESPVCQRLPLTSFLILPFQRITRLKMLVEVPGGSGPQ